MKHVKKCVLLWYSAREMYELVVDVESYPKFLPWCESSTILEQHEADPATGTPAGMTARLGLSYAGVRQSFTTRNEQVQGEVVKPAGETAGTVLGLADAPDARWLLASVAAPVSADDQVKGPMRLEAVTIDDRPGGPVTVSLSAATGSFSRSELARGVALEVQP